MKHVLVSASIAVFLVTIASSALAQSRAYVTSSGASNVVVLDTVADTVLGSFPVGANPSSVVVSADGRRAWVTNGNADTVSRIDTATGAVLATFPVGDAPRNAAISPDGSRLYVMTTPGVVDVVDTAADAVVASVPVGGDGGQIAVTPDGSRVWVASGLVVVIDAATNTVVDSFLPETAPVANVSNIAVGVAISPDGTRAYVSRVTFNFGGPTFGAGGGVVVVDTATDTVIATTNTGSLPGQVALTPNGSKLYVALQSTFVNVGTAQGFLPAKVVASIDTATTALVGWIVVSNRPAGLAVTPDGSEVYVAIPTSGTVAVIATATDTVSTSVPVGATPGAVATFTLPEPSITAFCAGDGSGTPCPCGNESPAGAGVGCQNSLGTGGALGASGVARISSDSLVLHGAQMPDSLTIYFQGTQQAAGGAGVVVGDGLRCVGGQVIRLGVETNVGGASQYPGPGEPSISVKGSIATPGTVRTYQVWYRNPAAFCTSDTTNFTNGVEVRWEL